MRLFTIRPRMNYRRGSRSLFILGWLTAAGCGGSANPTKPAPLTPAPTQPQPDPLKGAAAASGKLVGAAIQSGLLRMPQYTTVLARHFDYVTAEYEMKMDVIAQSRASADFSPGDAIVGYALAN